MKTHFKMRWNRDESGWDEFRFVTANVGVQFWVPILGPILSDRCSWKGQLEKTSFKSESLQLENFCLSWKEPSEVGKNPAKLERTDRSWKISFEVGKFWLKFTSNFPTLPRTFQFRLEFSNFKLSNFILDFPTSCSFQLPFQTTRIPILGLLMGPVLNFSIFESNFESNFGPFNFNVIEILFLGVPNWTFLDNSKIHFLRYG